jgi:hypothetical protein
MSQIGTASHRKQDASWRRLRPVTILVTDDEYAALVAMLGRDPRSLPYLAEFVAKPSVIEGRQSGDSPTPG